MKSILCLLVLIGCSTVCRASYAEDWTLEAVVIDVLDKNETDKFIKADPDTHIAVNDHQKTKGLRIKITKCTPAGGHGHTRCKVGQTRAIVLNYDAETMKKEFTKGTRLKFSYTYTDSAVPPGYYHKKEAWLLIEVLTKNTPDQKSEDSE